MPNALIYQSPCAVSPGFHIPRARRGPAKLLKNAPKTIVTINTHLVDYLVSYLEQSRSEI
jgi:hypothetical protein